MKGNENLNGVVELNGIGVSPGISIGPCYILNRSRVHISQRKLAPREVMEEKKRFIDAVDQSRNQLQHIRSQINDLSQREHAMIIDTHLAILEDEMFADATLEIIENQRVNAEFALRSVLDETKKVFENIDDSYLRERFTDIDYVGERTLRNLVGKREQHVAEVPHPSVVVAHDLSPADTAQMSREKVLGFAITVGGPTSHTAIIARSLEIPGVVAVEGIFDQVQEGDIVIIDGTSGKVIIRPDEEISERYFQLKCEYQEIDRELHSEVELPAVTVDGFRVNVNANLEIIDELPMVEKHGADGIGLYRTEYLYLDRSDAPTEEEHYENYRQVVEAVAPNPVTIRTLDLGGDKFSHALPMPPELNPAMGLRAIRFCLREKDMFRTQLRAILRASAQGNVRIMFPMISGLREVRESLEIIEEVKAQLKKQGLPFDEKIPIGCMIEVPGAAVMAGKLAREVDFFSIGTNDLIQYTLAIDRVNEHVSYLYEPLHPAVLELIRQVVNEGAKYGREVAMCGEMAGTPLYIPLLLGLGITVLSMPSQAIPRAKRIVKSISMEDARRIAGEVFHFDTAVEIKDYLREQVREKWADAYPKRFFQEELSATQG